MLEYKGGELELFKLATNWKEYSFRKIKPLIKGDVVEIGSGISNNTEMLINDQTKSWLCVEPDPQLLEEARKQVKSDKVTFMTGMSNDLLDRKFDTVIYSDVLEHIEDDVAEAQLIEKLLKPGGTVIINCPAHNCLYSKFDEQVGHYRRYNKSMMRAVFKKTQLKEQQLYYLDSVGALLSLANRLILSQSHPSKSQLFVWDKIVVPISRVLDPILFNRLGKCIIGVWRKE